MTSTGNQRRTRAQVSLLLFSIFLSNLPASAQGINEFETRYSASANGIAGHANRSLSRDGRGGFVFNSHLVAKVAGIEVARLEESSSFDARDKQLKPHFYQYKMSGLKHENKQIKFDWEAEVALSNETSASTTTALSEGTLDPLSYQLQLSVLLALEPSGTFKLNVIDDRSIETQTFSIIAQESIVTKLGTLDCVVVERVRQDDDRKSTRIWFAKNHSYLMVQLQQVTASGLKIELQIESAQIEGQKIGL